MSLNGSLEGLIEEMQRLLVAADAEVYERQRALDQAKAEQKRIRDLLRVAGALEEEPKAKPKREAKPAKVNDETRAAVLNAIKRRERAGESVLPDVRGSFTARDIEDTGLHTSSVRTAITVLRGEGIVRAIGLVPNSPRKAPMAYALVVEEIPQMAPTGRAQVVRDEQ
jgi:DNA-binding transcriptional ArsR family regulator